VGGNGIVETSNGGVTWITPPLPSGATEFNGVSCAAPGDCQVLGEAGNSPFIMGERPVN
jgi:hypothetical protein